MAAHSKTTVAPFCPVAQYCPGRTVHCCKMPRDKDRCDWVGAPYENKDDRNFYFAMNKGTRRFALGDTIEINIKESGVPTVGELESLYEDMEGLKWMVCRWYWQTYTCFVYLLTKRRYYTWQDIYNEVKDTPLRSQITPENLDPKVCCCFLVVPSANSS